MSFRPLFFVKEGSQGRPLSTFFWTPMLASYAAILFVPRYGDHKKAGVIEAFSFPLHVGEP